MLTLTKFEGKTKEEALEKCLSELSITEEKIYIIPIEDCDKPVKVVIK